MSIYLKFQPLLKTTQISFTKISPMTFEYANRTDYVTLTIPLSFITKIVCKECDEEGPHITSEHIFRINLTTASDGSQELKLFNDHSDECVIPRDTNTFKLLKERVSCFGDQAYFYGRVDEDDRSKLYINIKKLP